jgi:2-polyprenyl-6-methoxyphenol hydroxylase-like FAD-dependent oxidoreductase
MAAPGYDIITVGGGIAGSSLALAMAGRGAKVLVLEREKQFKDRVRGEALVPWGVAEASELGICGLLKEKCACMPQRGGMAWHAFSRSVGGRIGIAGASCAPD